MLHGLLVLVVLGMSLGVRLYRMDEESLWYDELCSVRYLGEENLGTFLRAQQRAATPMVPFYFILEYGWWQVFGGESEDSGCVRGEDRDSPSPLVPRHAGDSPCLPCGCCRWS